MVIRLNIIVCLVVALVYVMGVRSVWAAEPLVDVDWVKENYDKSDVVVLDLRTEYEYRRFHIPGAVFARHPFGGWRVVGRDRIARLPSPALFEKLIGNLEIGNQNHVVLVSRGETVSPMAVAAQVYWTFKVMGHDAVSILNGGMRAYSDDLSSPRANKSATRPTQPFTAKLRPQLVANADHIRAMLQHGRGTIIDFRAYGVFSGVNKEFRIDRYGTIPGAKHLSFAWLTIDAGGYIREPGALKRIFNHVGIALNGPVIAFSDQGLLGALGWFVVSELLGHKDARVYDASFRDWALDADNPIERRLNPGADYK